MFDFDPDAFEDDVEIEDVADFDPDSFGDDVEDVVDFDPDAFEDYAEDNPEAEIESETEDDSIIEEAIIGGAIFGMGIEAGLGEKEIAKETYREFDEFENERENCISLKERRAGSGKSKLRPFEQWVQDVIQGRKKLDDD